MDKDDEGFGGGQNDGFGQSKITKELL